MAAKRIAPSTSSATESDAETMIVDTDADGKKKKKRKKETCIDINIDINVLIFFSVRALAASRVAAILKDPADLSKVEQLKSTTRAKYVSFKKKNNVLCIFIDLNVVDSVAMGGASQRQRQGRVGRCRHVARIAQ